MVGNAFAEASILGEDWVMAWPGWAGARLNGEGVVQPVVLLVLITLAVSHWLLEPVVQVLQPFFLLNWLPWVFLGVGLWLLAGDDSQNSAR